MPLLGAHESIAGGFQRAVERAAAVGCQTVQIFTAAPQQWPVAALRSQRVKTAKATGKKGAPTSQPRATCRPIGAEEAELFRAKLDELQISHPIAHSSYLINVASPEPALWERSVAALAVELARTARLGIPYLVLHPGAYVSDNEEAGLARASKALDEAHERADEQSGGRAASCLLETTAGQGTCLGWKFEHLAEILAGVRNNQRLGLCLDTCHLFAAGYPLQARSEYQDTIGRLDDLVGLVRVRAIHVNDSQKGLGSRVDRHAHIGHGKLGLEPFRHFLNDRRFRDTPMYLETPKGQADGEDWDAINLRVLRGLVE